MKRAILPSLLWIAFLTSCAHSPQIERTQDSFHILSLNKEKTSNDEAVLLLHHSPEALLIKKDGTVLHSWKFPNAVLTGKLTSAGNFVGLFRDPQTNRRRVAGLIQIYNPQSQLLWEFKDPGLHHDFDVTESEDVYAIRYKAFSASAQKIFKSLPSKGNGQPVCDEVIQISKESSAIVWKLDLEDYFDFKKVRPTGLEHNYVAAFNVHPLCHANSVRFLKTNPINHQPAVLVSLRNLNTVLLVDRNSKRLLWKSPEGSLNHQHDARMYGDVITVFNNNSSDAWNHTAPSEVKSFNLKSGEERILFKQDAPDTYQPFTSATQSGVEIEKNGNLLITNTDYSQIWEVTPQGEPVLKIYTFSPYLSNELSSYVFRTESYDFASLKKMGLAGSAN
ncbi:MAG TPA: arylsulfotransferase family protein [Bdellovibrio sp.]|uniref:arylsulfotransferase family protein n=1 Tax=Bdellovibrio sp. TaxID=28201 RepID=UPI002F218C89